MLKRELATVPHSGQPVNRQVADIEMRGTLTYHKIADTGNE